MKDNNDLYTKLDSMEFWLLIIAIASIMNCASSCSNSCKAEINLKIIGADKPIKNITIEFAEEWPGNKLQIYWVYDNNQWRPVIDPNYIFPPDPNSLIDVIDPNLFDPNAWQEPFVPSALQLDALMNWLNPYTWRDWARLTK